MEGVIIGFCLAMSVFIGWNFNVLYDISSSLKKIAEKLDAR